MHMCKQVISITDAESTRLDFTVFAASGCLPLAWLVLYHDMTISKKKKIKRRSPKNILFSNSCAKAVCF